MLEARELTKHFVIRHNPLARFRHPDHIVRAVDGVSFTVNQGEVFGIIGESGCGKTTLAKCLLRLYRPTGGDVLFREESTLTMNREALTRFRRSVQPVFQDADSTLDPRQKISAVLEEPLLIHRLGNGRERRRQVSAVLDKVNLSASLLGRHPSELSGGQRQRVAIARALLLNPELIIADELVSGLDPVVTAQILDLLLSLRSSAGVTLVFISHDLETVNYISDRIVVMYRGRIVEMIDGAQFEKNTRHPYTRFLLGQEPNLSAETLPESVHHADYGESCGYAPLCPHHTPECDRAIPELQPVAPGQQVACHRINPLPGK